MGRDREELIGLAEKLNEARLLAKPDGEHVARAELSDGIGVLLVRTLMLLVEEMDDLSTVYEGLLAGMGVREALALVEEGDEDGQA